MVRFTRSIKAVFSRASEAHPQTHHMPAAHEIASSVAFFHLAVCWVRGPRFSTGRILVQGSMASQIQSTSPTFPFTPGTRHLQVLHQCCQARGTKVRISHYREGLDPPFLTRSGLSSDRTRHLY